MLTEAVQARAPDQGRQKATVGTRAPATTLTPTPSGALRCLDDHHIVVMAAMPLQTLAPHADLVAHEFIAELERIQPVARDVAVARPDHPPPPHGVQLVP